MVGVYSRFHLVVSHFKPFHSFDKVELWVCPLFMKFGLGDVFLLVRVESPLGIIAVDIYAVVNEHLTTTQVSRFTSSDVSNVSCC